MMIMMGNDDYILRNLFEFESAKSNVVLKKFGNNLFQKKLLNKKDS